MKSIRKYLLASLLIPALLFSQKPNFTFKSIDQPDGLINGTVMCMFEDSYGFMWIGTQNGLQRYDGTAFRNFEQKDNETNGLAGNFVYGLCEDDNRDLWITSAEGLNKYDRKNDRVAKYDISYGDTLENNRFLFSAVMKDVEEEGILWLTARNQRLVRLDTRNNSVVSYPINQQGNGQPRILMPYPGNTDKILLGSTALIAFDNSTGRTEELLVLEQNKAVPDNMINAAVIDPDDPTIIWLATGDFWGRGTLGGLIRFNLVTREKRIFTPENSQGEMQDINLLSLCPDGSDRLWIGTRYSGVLLYLKSQDRFYGYKNNAFDRGSFVSTNAVRSILKDRSGTTWFGTWGDGISLLSPARQKFTWFKHLPDDRNSLPGNEINTFAEDKYGNIWIGTKGAGLSKFNPENRTFENYFPEFAAPDHPVEILYLFYDSRDKLWIATHDDALFRFDPDTGEKKHYTKGESDGQVSQNRVSTVTEIEPGEILISTYGGGLDVFSYGTNSFRRYVNDPDDPNSIPDNQVWLPFKGPDGKYYFSGNSTAGLFRFDPKKETFEIITDPRRTGTSMMPAKVSDTEFYIGEIGKGLTRLAFGDKLEIKSVRDADGNRIINIEGILVDGDKNLWIGTGNGLVEFDPVTKITKRYGPDDGLQGFTFNRLAAFKASTGEMYFGGTNGFSVFHPDNIRRSDFRPPVVFTGLRLFQEPLPIGPDSPLKENITTTGTLVFDHDQNDFSISFAALDFANPHKIRYKYILENHDIDWIYSGFNNSASYTNMDPGNYILKVIATNSDGIWNETPGRIRIVIRPPWWQTWWAYVIYGLFLVAGIFAVDRFQRRRLLEKERIQAREKELAQAKEIEKAYEELKATQKQLIHSEKMASLGELTAGIAHEIQNPLNFVNNFSEVNLELIGEAEEEYGKGNHPEVKTILNDIRGNEQKIRDHGRRADSIVKSMLQHSRTSKGQKEPTDIKALGDEYLRLAFHGLRAKDKSFNADFRLEADDKLPKVRVVPQDIGRVLLNLINNAFHAVSAKALAKADSDYKPEVVVSIRKAGNHLEVQVKDNGPGIPAEIRDKIFQPFFTTKPTGEGTGLGLSLSYDIITKGHGGELRLDSKENEGSRFTILLPLTD